MGLLRLFSPRTPNPTALTPPPLITEPRPPAIPSPVPWGPLWSCECYRDVTTPLGPHPLWGRAGSAAGAPGAAAGNGSLLTTPKEKKKKTNKKETRKNRSR